MNDIDCLQAAQNYAECYSTCEKVHVGSMIITKSEHYRQIFGKDQHVLGTNYGICNCKENGCRRKKLYGNASKEHRLPSDCDSIHSEIDAICRAAERGIQTWGATIYVTRYPCEACARAIVSAGIGKVVYGRKEEISEYTKKIFENSSVEVVKADWNWEDNNE